MSLASRISEFLLAVAADVKSLTSQIGAKLDTAGGTLTGKLIGSHISAKAASYKTHVLAVTSGTKNLDISAYSVFDYTITGNTTLNFTNPPDITDETLIFVLRLTMGATLRTITFGDSITWLTQDAVQPPVPTINKTKEYVITCSNSTYTGRVVPFY